MYEKIRAAIRAAGGKERLVAMGSVFRFVDGDTASWNYTTVHATSVDALTVEEWVDRWASLRMNRKAA